MNFIRNILPRKDSEWWVKKASRIPENKFDERINCYSEALKCNPHYIPALLGMVYSYTEAENFYSRSFKDGYVEKKEESLRKVLEFCQMLESYSLHSRDEFQMLILKSNAYVQLGLYQDGRETIEQCIKIARMHEWKEDIPTLHKMKKVIEDL